MDKRDEIAKEIIEKMGVALDLSKYAKEIGNENQDCVMCGSPLNAGKRIKNIAKDIADYIIQRERKARVEVAREIKASAGDLIPVSDIKNNESDIAMWYENKCNEIIKETQGER